MTVTIEPENATNKNVTYSIDSADITVSPSGKIEWDEATPAGDYTTTVSTEDGGFTDTHTLTLEESDE